MAEYTIDEQKLRAMRQYLTSRNVPVGDIEKSITLLIGEPTADPEGMAQDAARRGRRLTQAEAVALGRHRFQEATSRKATAFAERFPDAVKIKVI